MACTEYTDNILSILEGYTLTRAEDIALAVAADMRRRRVEKNITRKQLSENSGVAQANLARFEQKGKISFENLIKLAMALGYTAEVKSVFAVPKYSTMAELDTIRRNQNKKKPSGK